MGINGGSGIVRTQKPQSPVQTFTGGRRTKLIICLVDPSGWCALTVRLETLPPLGEFVMAKQCLPPVELITGRARMRALFDSIEADSQKALTDPQRAFCCTLPCLLNPTCSLTCGPSPLQANFVARKFPPPTLDASPFPPSKESKRTPLPSSSNNPDSTGRLYLITPVRRR